MALAGKGKVSYAELQNVIVFYQFCISLFASFPLPVNIVKSSAKC